MHTVFGLPVRGLKLYLIRSRVYGLPVCRVRHTVFRLQEYDLLPTVYRLPADWYMAHSLRTFDLPLYGLPPAGIRSLVYRYTVACSHVHDLPSTDNRSFRIPVYGLRR